MNLYDPETELCRKSTQPLPHNTKFTPFFVFTLLDKVKATGRIFVKDNEKSLYVFSVVKYNGKGFLAALTPTFVRKPKYRWFKYIDYLEKWSFTHQGIQ